MRILGTSLVFMALWGLVAPRVVACCCPSMAAGSPQAQSALSNAVHSAAPVRGCCHAPSGSESKPSSDSPDSQHDGKGCHGCYCGMFCCGKLVVPAPRLTEAVAAVSADTLVISSDSLPSSMTLSPMLKPPRQG